MNLKQIKAIYKYIRATNEENIDYLNNLLDEEDWGMFVNSSH
jgi:succinate dehydrogenase flavin-adding protein (antitoxin of CptAB toxin-antitoxin module)